MIKQRIISPKNEKIKYWKRLKKRKEREKFGTYLIEGEHLMEEALRAQAKLQAVMIREPIDPEWEAFFQQNVDESVPLYQLPPNVFSQIAQTDSPPSMMAEVKQKRRETHSLKEEKATYLLLDRIQDPGNLGTILRTAQATGVTCVFLGNGTVDPYNEKVVRAAMGAIFYLPFVMTDLSELCLDFQKQGIPIIGTTPSQGLYSFQYRFPDRVAILLGNEAQGIQPSLLEHLDVQLQIPMPGEAESFNVAIACGMLLYERVRQTYME